MYESLLEVAADQQTEAGPREEADCLATQFSDFKYLISLVVWYDVRFQINLVRKAMQNPTVDVATCCDLLKACASFISN